MYLICSTTGVLISIFWFSSSLWQNKLHLYDEEKRILYLHIWLSTEQRSQVKYFSSTGFRISLTNYMQHCIIRSPWYLFPLLMFFKYHAQPFLQYLWHFRLEVQSHALKVTCLALVVSAVNHYLSPSDIINIVFHLLEEGAHESDNQHAHWFNNIWWQQFIWSLFVSHRPWQSLPQNFSDAKHEENPKSKSWMLKYSTLPWCVSQNCALKQEITS